VAILNFLGKNLISNSLLAASKIPGYEVLNYRTDIKVRTSKHMD